MYQRVTGRSVSTYGIFGDRCAPEQYGAAACTVGQTGSVSSGSTAFTDGAASFTSADIGKTIIVGATGYSSTLVTTIAAVASGTAVTLAAPAPAPVASLPYVYGSDATAAFSALSSALEAGSEVFIGGMYLVPSGSVTIGKTCVVTGAGSVGVAAAGGAAIGGSGIVVTSPTGSGIIENAPGVTMRDFGVWNLAASTPTGGAGISVVSGAHSNKRSLTVSGFYDDIDFTATSGPYPVMADCRLLDPVRYGVLYRNAQPSSDYGDAGFTNNTVVCTSTTRAGTAAVRWESGGGLRWIGNKINAAYAAPWQYGIKLAAATTASTSVLVISANSVENCSVAGIAIGAETGSSGSFQSITITGNEIGTMHAAASGIVIANATYAQGAQIRSATISGNVFNFWEAGATAPIIWVYNVQGVHIGQNMFGDGIALTAPLIALGGGTDPGAGTQAVMVDRQAISKMDNITLIQDSRAIGSTAEQFAGGVTYDDTRHAWIAAANTDLTLYSVDLDTTGPKGTGAILSVEVMGHSANSGHTSPGNLAVILRQERTLTTPGGGGSVTVATLGTDVAVGGGAAYLTLTYDISVSNRVTIKLKTTDATQLAFFGQVRVRVDGKLARFRKGA